MDHRAIRGELQAVPFCPFRMRTVDGRTFDVLHRDYLIIAQAGRWVTHYTMDTQATTLLEPMLIVSLEYLPVTPPAGANGTAPT